MDHLQHVASPSGSQRSLDWQRTSDFQAALLGMAGHDLRQPLQVIQTAYEWLGSRAGNASERARVARGERAIARLTEQLDRLVGALRLYEQSKNMHISAVTVAPLLQRLVSENEEAAQEKGVELRAC